MKKIKAVTGHQSRPLREIGFHVALEILNWGTEDSFRKRRICGRGKAIVNNVNEVSRTEEKKKIE